MAYFTIVVLAFTQLHTTEEIICVYTKWIYQPKKERNRLQNNFNTKQQVCPHTINYDETITEGPWLQISTMQARAKKNHSLNYGGSSQSQLLKRRQQQSQWKSFV